MLQGLQGVRVGVGSVFGFAFGSFALTRRITGPIFHLFALGVSIGCDANFSVPVGGNANFSDFRYQHVGIPNAKLLGVLPNPTAQRECFRFAVEYRLKG